jgi:regulation of enolase protein 1 (concanavalin A-like superfamily)
MNRLPNLAPAHRSGLLVAFLLAATALLLSACDPTPGPFQSDDFSSGYLGSKWRVIDPVGDGTVSFSGLNTPDARVELSVPAGVDHQPWATNNSLRLMQKVANVDVGIEAKFDSMPTSAFQEQGILVQQDAQNYLRFDIHHDGANVKAFVARVINGTPTSVANVAIPTSSSVWTRVTRTGNQWTYQTSSNGTTWVDRASFNQALTVAETGVFAGNFGSGAPAPAWTALVDYVFNTQTPIVPEDPTGPRYEVTTQVVGQGTVHRFPDLPDYAEGGAVTLAAVPDPGWAFEAWSGDATGNAPLISLTADSDLDVTATFVAATDVEPPIITSVSAGSITSSSAVISWTTNEPATSAVAHGPTAAYELGTVGAGAHVTSHEVTLQGLAPATTYHYQVSSTDPSSNSSLDVDRTFTTAPAPPPAIVSDDFRSGALGVHWTAYDPLGDGSVSFSGVGTSDARLNLAVPAGVNHEPWVPNESLHVMQEVSDGDFGLEAKFDSVPVTAFQEQGILVRQDDSNYLRFEFHHNGANLKAFVARIVNDVPTTVANVTVPTGSSLWARVIRTGNQWTFQTSTNGTTWATRADFAQTLTSADVGVFAGNYGSGSSAPAWTALVDYVFDLADPIVPEDPVGAPVDLTTSVAGQGSVQRTPDQPTYFEGQQVELTAVPAPGWAFTGWSGDVVSSVNPLTLDLVADTDVVATFVEQADADPPIISDVVATGLTPNTATIMWSTDELATSSVSYGPTTAYENGSVASGSFVVDHSVPLTGLMPNTTYHYRVSSTDQNSNVATDIDRTFTTLPASSSGPAIDVWYGNEQTFGVPGMGQRWVNVLGRATDPNGVMSMSYRLNGGPAVAMGVGPDGRRLVNPGDFNVDILVSDLLPGANTVQIDAVDGTFDLSSTVVTVNLQSGTTWPLPYSPDLFTADEVADFGQVVDGKWEVANGQLRTVDTDIGYDRLVAIGDDSWTDYEATFTMRVNSLANPTGPASGQPAAGFLLRWNGHNAVGPGHQPQRGYVPNGTSDPTPFGAYGLWRNSATGGGRL